MERAIPANERDLSKGETMGYLLGPVWLIRSQSAYKEITEIKVQRPVSTVKKESE